PLVTGGCTAVTTDRGPALDGSGIFLSIDPTNGTVIKLKDGTQITPLANREDTNGNISSASIDNLGRALVNRVDNGPAKTFTTPLGRTLNRSYTNSSINYIDSAGATQAYQIDYTAIDIQTSFTSPCRDTSCSEL